MMVISAMSPRSSSQASRYRGLRARLVRALSSCGTEADIIQLLYSELHPEFGYDPIGLQVLEREGWYHLLAMDHGLLQDVRRRRLLESIFGPNFEQAETVVAYPKPAKAMAPEEARGPGGDKAPQTVIWVPIQLNGRLIGAVTYQLYVRRKVPARERALLEEVHAHMGVVVNSAYLNELTRNQAVSLSALNSIARALSATRDEYSVVLTLRNALGLLLPVDELELAIVDGDIPGRCRLLSLIDGHLSQGELAVNAPRFAPAQAVIDSGRPTLAHSRADARNYPSVALVPIKEGGDVSAVLSVRSRQPEAYEQSTLVFLQQVADQAGLALRNAWSYASVERQARRLEVANAELDAQRRRLQVVDVIGRRLASSLDRRSITITLRHELSQHLIFDLFLLATVEESSAGPTSEAYVQGPDGQISLAELALDGAGPALEAYTTGRPVVIQDHKAPGSSAVNGPPETNPVLRREDGDTGRFLSTAGSILWVPVHHSDRVTALLSLQAHREGAFGDWEVQLLKDVAAHVSLALSTAEHFNVAQTERRRLETLHVLESGVAGAADECQITEALWRALKGSVDSSGVLVVYLDARGQLSGFVMPVTGSIRRLTPKPVERTAYFQRLTLEARTIVESTGPDVRRGHAGWSIDDLRRWPAQVVWVPLIQAGRVVGALSVQRYEDRPFSREEVKLVESAAPVLGIALRTVRLHRANELALRHSVRIQELAALAGHDLTSVVRSVAEQASSMLDAVGAACWAFNEEGLVAAYAGVGDARASRALRWAIPAGREKTAVARSVLSEPVPGVRGRMSWSLVPLQYGTRLVGALGFVLPAPAFEEVIDAPEDFVRTAAVAIENARLVAETWGRIRTLEAVAAFADLDISQPERARAEIGRLAERALADARGTFWLVDGAEMVSSGGSKPADRVSISRRPVSRTSRNLAGSARRHLAARHGVRPDQVLAAPVVVDGELVGMLTAFAVDPSPAEVRRLLGVLASQIGLVLGRLRLVSALDSQAETMEAMLTHSPVGVVLENAEGDVIYANPAIGRIYGAAAEEMIGHTLDRFLAQASAEVVGQPDAMPEGPIELRLGEKGEKVVQMRRVPIPNSAGHQGGVLTLHEDVTEERAILDAKDLMLRAVGHEVRSPAAAMRATIASLLQWDGLMEASQRRSVLEDAYEQSERLLNLVEAQLTIAKLEAGAFQPRAMPVSLAETAEQVLRVLGNRYGDRVGAVSFDFPASVAAFCEPTHLEQALTNLIGNALEHAWATRIVVTGRHRNGWLEVSVKDNGRGLPADRVDALFSRSPAGQHRARGGLGLGLYLCRLIVERSFGGRVWLQQTGSRGSTFRFTLPASGVHTRGTADEHARSQEPQD
jgi:PAS domain S-box-containing protein